MNEKYIADLLYWVAWMYLYRRHDGTVIRRMEGGRWNGDDAFEQVPLYTHPPAPTTQEPVAWIDSMGHPHHLSAIQGVREKQLYGPWRPLYD